MRVDFEKREEKERIFRDTMTTVVITILQNSPIPDGEWDRLTITAKARSITRDIINAAKEEAEK